MTIQAPYRFVPLSSLVVLPEWAEQVSLDKPFKDGICGELDITITTHGKVCVGGEQTVATEHQAGKVHFYKTPNGTPAIPGSSLKGMLRNVLEIATFSRFKQVEDQKLGVRDIRNAGNFYHEKIKNPEAGWLRFEEGEWKIYPCNFARLHQKNLIQSLGITYDRWARDNNKTIIQRYNLIGLCPKITFIENGENSQGQVKALPHAVSRDTIDGNIVVTGQPGRFYQQDKPHLPKVAKKYEFIFYDEFEALTPSPAVIVGFYQIYENNDEWTFWRNNLAKSPKGIPVFFHCEAHDSTKVRSLGLSMMYKLPYENSIHDAIEHTSNAHFQMETNYDLSDLIFGSIDEIGSQSLRGRVNIGLACLQNTVELSLTEAMILNGPKATYYPFYIYQDEHITKYSQLMETDVKVSGWKRYPIKDEDLINNNPDNLNVQSRLEVVPPNTIFKTKVRFHNLKAIELGALLWAIDFGNRKDLRHGLGHGKPYGFGQVQLEITDTKLRANDRSQVLDLQVTRQAFIDFMSEQIGRTFEELDPIQSLLKYARPNAESNLKYMQLDDFVTYKDPKDKHKVQDLFFNSKPVLAKSKIRINNSVLNEKLIAEILLTKPKNSSETEEIYILSELEKINSKYSDSEKLSLAYYLKDQYVKSNKWKEQSSSNKSERKLFDQTIRIKRFLG